MTRSEHRSETFRGRSSYLPTHIIIVAVFLIIVNIVVALPVVTVRVHGYVVVFVVVSVVVVRVVAEKFQTQVDYLRAKLCNSLI